MSLPSNPDLGIATEPGLDLKLYHVRSWYLLAL